VHGVDVRFQPTVMLRAIGQSVADDGDVVVLFELQISRLSLCRGWEGAGR